MNLDKKLFKRNRLCMCVCGGGGDEFVSWMRKWGYLLLIISIFFMKGHKKCHCQRGVGWGERRKRNPIFEKHIVYTIFLLIILPLFGYLGYFLFSDIKKSDVLSCL